MSKVAFVTGATAGIGRATAVKLAELGYELILNGRREERLLSLQSELQQKYSVKIYALSFDVSQRAAVEAALSSLGSVADRVDVLVNNAGLALGADKVQSASVDDWEVMIDTNIKGLLYLTRFFVPKFIKNARGHIVNLGSVAGRWVYPGGNVYCASKHAVKAISEGLRMDLLGTPVRITNIEPGMVDSDFSLVRFGDPSKAKAVYQGMTPLSPDDIADCIVWSLSRPPHVNIQEMVVFPTDQAAIQMVHRREN